MDELLLLSGGLDSAALAALRRPRIALVIDYGQRAAIGEVRAARAVGEALGIQVEALKVDCSAIGTGILAGKSPPSFAPSPEWWPYRNQLLITLAAAWGLTRHVTQISVALVSSDASRHADAGSDFVQGIDEVLRLQEGAIRVHAPAIEMTSVELIKRSELGRSVLAWTHSCHAADVACGSCPGCTKRAEVFAALRIG